MNNLQKILADAALRRRVFALAGMLTLALLSGCASIVGSKSETLSIKSSPPDAQILISDEAGRTTYRGRTPDQVALEKSDGTYWGGKKFTVTLSKRGYVTQQVQVDTHPNTFYLGGNLIFGGLIGWLLVDPASGKMYELSSDGIAVTLQALPNQVDTPPITPPKPPVVSEIPATQSSSATDLRPPPTTTLPAIVAEPARGGAPAETPRPVPPHPDPAAQSIFIPERPASQAENAPAMTAPSAKPAPGETPPKPEPAVAPEANPPRPYWPAPPPLPVSPSTALPAVEKQA